MVRPAREDNIYKVGIHRNGVYMYAATHMFTTSDMGKRLYKHVHWGTVTPEGKFMPGKQYLYATTEERGKLIFPKDWDLSEIDKLASNHKKGRTAHEGEDVNRLYGDVWLLEQVADKVGLRKDLMTVFDGNAEMVGDILTLAYFPFLTGYDYTRASQKVTADQVGELIVQMLVLNYTRKWADMENALVCTKWNIEIMGMVKVE